jgi:hypothetical protein
MSIDGGAIGLKIAIDLVKRPAMSGLARVHSWLTGHEVLVVGPARAGKTSFVEYLQYGVLEPEQETAKTLDLRKSATFRLKIGRNSSLELKVRRAVDVAGQVGPMEHAKIVEERRPHAVVVLLDLSAPVTHSAAWLTDFCKHLDERLRTNMGAKKRLKVIVFVANKQDTLSPDAAVRRIERFKQIIKKQMAFAFPTRVDSIPVMPCILVQKDNAVAMADAITIRLAKALAS